MPQFQWGIVKLNFLIMMPNRVNKSPAQCGQGAEDQLPIRQSIVTLASGMPVRGPIWELTLNFTFGGHINCLNSFPCPTELMALPPRSGCGQC